MGVEPAPALLKIGRVAERSGVSVKAIRFYCDQGLLAPASRSEGGYRLFHTDVFAELALIRNLRGLGLSLDTIGQVLVARRSGLCTCSDLQAMLRRQQREIQARIRGLQALDADLNAMLTGWQACGGRDIRGAHTAPPGFVT